MRTTSHTSFSALYCQVAYVTANIPRPAIAVFMRQFEGLVHQPPVIISRSHDRVGSQRGFSKHAGEVDSMFSYQMVSRRASGTDIDLLPTDTYVKSLQHQSNLRYQPFYDEFGSFELTIKPRDSNEGSLPRVER